MNRITSRFFGIAVALLLPSILFAELTVDRLIQETGVREGPFAMRDFSTWREPQKIIVRGSEETVNELRENAPGIDFVAASSEADAIQHSAGADAIIGFCSERLLDAASDATWIQVFSAGVERCVYIDQVQDSTVVLTNMQKMSSPVLAEHAIAMVMTLSRGLVLFGKSMHTGEWQRGGKIANGMQEISGKTLLVVGLGGIGTEVARRASALGMRVLGTRRSSHEGPDFVEYVGLSNELHTLAGKADFIVNTLPLTDETTGVFGAEFFAAAKKGAHFVSVGRGASTVTEDLMQALQSGQIAGAGLDVTDPEPLPSDHPLWQTDNVIITPHVAGWGGGRERHTVFVSENVRRFIAGEALLNVVDPQRGY